MRPFLMLSLPPLPNPAVTQLSTALSRITLDFSAGPYRGSFYLPNGSNPTASQFALVGGTRTITSVVYFGSQVVRVNVSAGTDPTAITYTPAGSAAPLSLTGWRFNTADPAVYQPVPVPAFTRNLTIV